METEVHGVTRDRNEEEEKIAITFFRKIRSHEEGKSEGENLQLADLDRNGIECTNGYWY